MAIAEINLKRKSSDAFPDDSGPPAKGQKESHLKTEVHQHVKVQTFISDFEAGQVFYVLTSHTSTPLKFNYSSMTINLYHVQDLNIWQDLNIILH